MDYKAPMYTEEPSIDIESHKTEPQKTETKAGFFSCLTIE